MKGEGGDVRPGVGVTAALLLLVLVGGLVVYKSTGALRQVERVSVTGSLAPRAALFETDSATRAVRVAAKTLNYLDAVWPALVFGVLISAAVRAFIPVAAVARLFDRGRLRSQLIGGASGAPLMLCSCCVAPIFSSVYERSRHLAPSLALMIAAPALNPAALVLTFLLFPADVAWARLWMSLAAVFVGTALVVRLAGKVRDAARRLQTTREIGDEPHGSDVVRFVTACGQVAVRTVPIILLGVVIAALLTEGMQIDPGALPSASIWAIAITAAVAVPVALPTFSEIPLAATLIAAGAPAGAAAALLFVGPAVNLPSLFTVGRVAGWKTAILIASMVWLVAVAGGLVIG
jgi:uncharacterized membrane protein YraQ (UPF0718 family)